MDIRPTPSPSTSSPVTSAPTIGDGTMAPSIAAAAITGLSVNWVGWTIFGCIGLLIIAFSFGFVRYYRIKGEPTGLTGFIGFISLVFTLLSLFLIPIDIYLVNSKSYDDTLQNGVKYTYYAFYAFFMLCVFIGLPFGYFYYEELGDTENPENTFCKRACAAFRFTIVTGIVWIALIVIGLYVSFNVKDDSVDDKWTNTVANKFTSQADSIIPFCMAVLTCIGMFFAMIYTSWGLASLPISFMKGQKIVAGADVDYVHNEMRKITNEIDEINLKYRGRKSDMSRREQIKLKNLQKKKQKLSQDVQKVQNKVSQKGCFEKCGEKLWSVSTPIRYAIGVLLLGFSLIIIVSMGYHLIDQIINSDCHVKCGFAIDNPSRYNPMNYLLQQTSKFFPMDYIFFTGLIFWLFLCSIVGIMTIGVRFICVKLFSLRAHATMHNALLMAIGFLILVICSFNYLLFDLAASYMTYGSQGVTSKCTIDTNPNPGFTTCNATQIFYLISVILIGMPAFGLIYFILSWFFIFIFIISFFYNIYKKPESKMQKLLDNDNDGLEAYFQD